MAKKTKTVKGKFRGCSGCSVGGGVYFVGFIGAIVYYLQTSTGFWAGVIGVLKALVWPAFLVYKLLGL